MAAIANPKWTRYGVVLVVVAVLLGLASARSASAYQTSGRGGGSTVPSFIQGAIYPFAAPQIQIPGREVYRMRGYSGPQRITVQWVVYQWQGLSGVFTTYASTSESIRTRPRRYAQYEPVSFEVESFRHYTVDIYTYWHRYGRVIGRRHIHYVDTDDYACYGSGACSVDVLGGRAAIYLDELG